MLAGKSQGAQQPSAWGSMLQVGSYGQPIAENFGRTKISLWPTWANGMREGGSGKKFKNAKKGITTYEENITFIRGVNPSVTPLQMWLNGGKYPLEFTTLTFGYENSGQIWIPNSIDPDPDFWAVIAVTITESFSQTFHDYGDPAAPRTVSGNWERPLWNQLFAGPDPTDQSGQRFYPYCYRWKPSYGPTFFIDAMADNVFGVFNTLTVYYARKTAATSFLSPIAKLRLHDESELGDGDEYDGFSSQQILYPQYCGLGSQNLDLGATGTIPQLEEEELAKFAVYPTGDADFVDIAEYIFKSGALQAGLESGLRFSGIQNGVGLYDFPGAIQKKYFERIENHNQAAAFDMPNTAGNILVAYIQTGHVSAGLPVVTDSLGNTWTQRASWTDSGGTNMIVATCENCLGGDNTISWTNGGFYNTTVFLLEIPGQGYVFDDAEYVTSPANPSVSVTTTNAPGMPAILLGVNLGGNPANTNLYPVILNSQALSQENLQYRNVTTPGTYALTSPGGYSLLALIAWKATQPPTYANPLPNILDPITRELTRAQCRANGLWGSLTMNAQKPAREWIQDCLNAASCVALQSGFQLKLIPRSEVSTAGNGAVYNSPTAGGPVADLDVDAGDFVAGPNELPIQFKRPARTDLSSILQMQHVNRNSDYQQIVSQFQDTASILKYGVRFEDPVVNNAIQDPSVAMALLRIGARRRNWVECGPLATFKLNARWQHLEAMDLVTITWRARGMLKQPFRLTVADEDDKCLISGEAEPWYYGLHSPVLQAFDGTTPNVPQTNNSAGSVNAPVFLEPTPRLYGSQNQAQLWIVVSSPSVDYGGCQPYISTDGGASYNPAGDPLVGNGITGVSTADWPAASDPDTTNDLALDLTESLGTLASYQTSDEDNFLYPCYVAGGGAFTIPYELMTYATATLTATNKYTLKATGSGNKLRRGVWGAPSPGVGVDHPLGSRFAFLDPAGTGILKLSMDPQWIGKTLHFKFPTFNTFGGSAQALSDCTDYTYTPSGAPGSVNPTGAPAQLFLVNGA